MAVQLGYFLIAYALALPFLGWALMRYEELRGEHEELRCKDQAGRLAMRLATQRLVYERTELRFEKIRTSREVSRDNLVAGGG